MKLFRKTLIISMGIILLFSLGCGKSTGDKMIPEENVELTVSAAASLKSAMEEIKSVYEEENSGVQIAFNFASSGSLQQQIEQGAPVDVFVSAATKQMDALQEKELIIVETRKEFLENKIVLIVPKDSELISNFEGLTSEAINQVALGEPSSVPAGQYADQVLRKLEILDGIQTKVVYGKDVREILTWVETKNADVGMVYSTDAKLSDKVKVVEMAPEGSHDPIYYPAAVVKDSKEVEDAKMFIEFLYSSEAQPIFQKYGFNFITQ